MAKRTLYDRLMTIDRRIIFTVMILAVVLPLGFKKSLQIPIKPGTYSQRFYEEVEKLEKGDIVTISGAYDPSSAPEIQPMVKATLRHVFRKGGKVITLALDAKAPPLLEAAVREVSLETEFQDQKLTYGKDFVHLGYMSGFLLVIKAMNRSIPGTFPKDMFGTPIENLDLMKGVVNFEQIAIGMEFASLGVSSAPTAAGLVMFAKPHNPKFRVLAGSTAVMAPEEYPYLQSEQVKGFLGGMKGVADYESLLKLDLDRATGRGYMPSQSAAHLVIILFIALGNLGFWLERRKRRNGKGA